MMPIYCALRRSLARAAATMRVIVITSAIALLVLAADARRATAQLSYTHTTFLNGFASDSTIWTRTYPDLAGPTPPEYLARTVELRTVGYPSVKDSFAYYGQRSRIVPFFVSGTQHVLVGHSLGALIARGLYVDNAVPAPNITGIVAVAAPHQGAPLAQNIETAHRFLVDVQRRVNDGVGAARVVAPVFTRIVTSLFFGPGVGQFASLVAIGVANRYITNPNINLDQLSLLERVPVLPDLRPDSGVVRALNSNLADAAIPHANVYGTISSLHAPLRVLYSMRNDDAGFDAAASLTDKGMSLFKGCKYIGYGTIIASRQARRCAYAAKVLGRLDDRWALYVNGADANGRPRQVPFDGVVPNERSRYPGGSTNLKYDQPVSGANHMNIYKTRAGLDAVAAGMLRIGMEAVRVPLAASVSGLEQIDEGSSSTWAAEVTGGTPPYSYSWSGLLSGSGSSISGTLWSSGDLYLQVTDAAGMQVSAAKSITVTSTGTGCPGSQVIC